LLSLFMPNWYLAHLMHHVVGRASRHDANRWRSDTLQFWLSNTLDSGAFRGAQAQWDKMTVPMLSVGNWTGMGLHLRGNTEAFMRAATPHKKLRIHTGTHVHPFYSEEGRRDQLRFFDYWLKDVDNGVMDEPPVKLAIRKGGDEVEWRFEHEWPLARTRWTKFYFDLSQPPGKAANAARLVGANPAPVAKGWLRVSHRELDPELSLPYRPYHRHRRRLHLAPDEIVRVEVEIWPTSMVFRRGHRIRLDVQPRDGIGSAGYMHYHADY